MAGHDQRTNDRTAVATEPPDERFRLADKALWSHYGLEPAEQWVELDSSAARVRVQEIGSGPPVLLIGGTGGTGAYWAPLVRHLGGLRCLIIDRPGFGLSSPIDYGAHRYQTVAADFLHGVLEALEVERAHVIGASIGGVWALGLAARHPGRVGRLVQLGGSPLVEEIRPPLFIRLLASPLGALMIRTAETPRMLHKQLRGLGHDTSLEDGRMDAYIDWHLALTRHTTSMRNERHMVRAILNGKAWQPGLTFAAAALATIDHRTLMVYGTSDPIGSVDLWQRFAELLPNGELQLVDDGGHLVWYDDPTGVGERVRGFLDG